MKLYERWLVQAYDRNGSSVPKFWDVYSPLEQKIYEDIISNKIEVIDGTMTDLSEKYGMPVEYICGFIDGINDIQDTPLKMEELDENSKITLNIDFKKLYQKMVEYKAAHLYSLEAWNNVFDKDTLENLYQEQKSARTVVKETKIGRNDPCICGSGKKYKVCCGA